MWPRKGVVVNRCNGLIIRLQNGSRIRVAEQKGIKLGDTVHVLWDFTTNRPRQIWTDVEYNSTEELADDELEFQLPPDWEPREEWAADPHSCSGCFS